MRFSMLVGACGMLLQVAPATAETKVELNKVHMCCGGCAKEVATILKKVEGVTEVACDQKTTTARFTAADAKTAQRALDALANGGFHGDIGDNTDCAFRDDAGAKAGKVKSLTVSGFHNSCPGCVKSFREAIKDVPGVASDTAKSKVSTCVVTGDFDPVALVAALNKAGFHVQVK